MDTRQKVKFNSYWILSSLRQKSHSDQRSLKEKKAKKTGRRDYLRSFGKFKTFCYCCWVLNCVWLFATPWTAAHQASLSFTISQSLLELMSIELVMPFTNLILCHPLLLLPPAFNLSQHQGLFQWVSSLYQVATSIGASASASVPPMNEYSGLISFRIDWVDLTAQGTLKSSPTPQFFSNTKMTMGHDNGSWAQFPWKEEAWCSLIQGLCFTTP